MQEEVTEVKETIQTSVKEWIGNKLSSPYFTTAAVVWLVMNRIIIFGLFNFSDKQTLTDRVDWIQSEFSKHMFLWYFNWKGFYPTLFNAALLGFAFMFLYEYLGAFSSWVYEWGSGKAKELRANTKESKWYSRDYVKSLKKEYHDTELLRRENINNLTRLKGELDTEIESLKNEVEMYKMVQGEYDKVLNATEAGRLEESNSKPLLDLVNKLAQGNRTITVSDYKIMKISKYWKGFLDVAEQIKNNNNDIDDSALNPDVIVNLLRLKLITFKDNIYSLTAQGENLYEIHKALRLIKPARVATVHY